ncbi:MAG: OmpH family outer membrane protein [Burkholderiales bacterium]|uniref:OmpH family outer membrane protein n=1 Tax=Bradyrhizobium sp. TaxID=376 RepID=UPI003D097086
MLRFLLLVSIALALPAPTLAQDVKIGFVNTERILRESGPAQRAGKKLETEFSRKQQELQKLADQLKRLQDDLEKNGMTMAEAQRRSKEREFNDLNRELQRRDRDFRDEVNQRRNEETAQLVDQANRIIRQIAEQEKYDVILQATDALILNPKVDITDRVMKALDGKPPAR